MYIPQNSILTKRVKRIFEVKFNDCISWVMVMQVASNVMYGSLNPSGGSTGGGAKMGYSPPPPV